VQSMMTAIVGKGTTSSANNPIPNKSYKIGDTGPAGGIVFFDRGFTGDGWRYLEAAPAGAEFTAEWGTYGIDVINTMTTVGSGKQNTNLIVNKLIETGEINRAAQICNALDVNGYKDWFLPSKDELNVMYINLQKKGLGDFSNNMYWSSSQGSPSIGELYYCIAWYQRFDNGTQYCLYKGCVWLVRPIRAF